jgi:hypothetical protein
MAHPVLALTLEIGMLGPGSDRGVYRFNLQDEAHTCQMSLPRGQSPEDLEAAIVRIGPAALRVNQNVA